MLDHHSDTPTAQGFQERGDRHLTVLIHAAVRQGPRDGLCRIRNLSEGGIAIETSVALTIGAPAIVTLRSGRDIACDVRWVAGSHVGMTCGEDVVHAVKDVGPGAPSAPALPRFSRAIPVEIVANGRAHRCLLDSVSTTDALLTGAPSLDAGRPLTLNIRGLGPIAGAVRISDEDHLFLRFSAPIAFRRMDAWLANATS
jgi:hypothetical protein